jgi:hypothetical protein
VTDAWELPEEMRLSEASRGSENREMHPAKQSNRQSCHGRCPLRVIRVGFATSAICPVCRQQLTFPDRFGVSQTCQDLTHAPQHTTYTGCIASLDQLVGAH